ncbi:MAG TPA: GNAT family protein [Caulobacteraceae bacterium]|nr:GNAT family protein [Caulobacteraceae bacterium]
MSTSPDDPLSPVALAGRHVRLEPLSRDHHDGLVEAVRDGEPWRLWYTSVPPPEGMGQEIERRLGLQAAGSMLPFTVFDAPTGRIAGMTTYMNIDRAGPRVEIGSTWYAGRVQRTGLNTEAKRLLLAHAFDTLDCLAVELRTHVLNRESRRAIERIGAKLDGVLRCHGRAKDGSLRDTCVYSIVASEWPAVRANLEWMLAQPR